MPRLEKLILAVILILLLVPVALIQRNSDSIEDQIRFFRWFEENERIESEVEELGVGQETRTPEELALYTKIQDDAGYAGIDFQETTRRIKWATMSGEDMQDDYARFFRLYKEDKIGFAGDTAIQLTGDDVRSNLGGMVLGFSKLIADLLWLKVDEYFHKGMMVRMLPTMYAVVMLDPHFIDAYDLGAWHLAYNAYAAVKSLEEKQLYLNKGIEFLADGVRNNPRNSTLYFSMGFDMYYRKLKDWPKSVYYIGRAVQFEHEEYMERVYAHALEWNGQVEDAFKIIDKFDKEHPEYVAHKHTLDRLRQKLVAIEYEERGELEKALTIWERIQLESAPDRVAPKKVLELRRKIIESRSKTKS